MISCEVCLPRALQSPPISVHVCALLPWSVWLCLCWTPPLADGQFLFILDQCPRLEGGGFSGGSADAGPSALCRCRQVRFHPGLYCWTPDFQSLSGVVQQECPCARPPPPHPLLHRSGPSPQSTFHQERRQTATGFRACGLLLGVLQEKLKLVSVLGAGLLVGTSLAVIIPEGVHTLYTTNEHSKQICHHIGFQLH